MLICISIHAYTGTLCFRPIIRKRLNSSELVVQTIVYLVKGRQTLQGYLANRYDKPLLATYKVLGYLTQIHKGCHSEVAMLSIRCWFWYLKVSILVLLRMQMVAFFSVHLYQCAKANMS